jgi:hypothetical protein
MVLVMHDDSATPQLYIVSMRDLKFLANRGPVAQAMVSLPVGACVTWRSITMPSEAV